MTQDDGCSFVGLLPIKGNSERVRGKNFREFAGKPLFTWILDALLAAESVSRVVINTDARNRILEAGIEESDQVIIRDRPSELCGDMVSMNNVLRNDLENVDSTYYVMTHATNPLLSSETIQNAISFYLAQESKSMFSVSKTQTRFYNAAVEPVNHDPDSLVRTQDLEPWFEENSCLYLFSKKSFIESGARIGRSAVMYETPTLESFDIDDSADWTVAEAVARASGIGCRP